LFRIKFFHPFSRSKYSLYAKLILVNKNIVLREAYHLSLSSEFLLSRVTVIKQFYFFGGFVGDESFKSICNRFKKSNKFKPFVWADKIVFSEKFRKTGETFRTFEMKEGIRVLNLRLVNTELSGHLRVLITICRAGFVVLSMVYSIIPEMGLEEVRKLKNLISLSPLTSIDVGYLLEEEKIPAYPFPLKHEVYLGGTTVEMSQNELLERLLKNLEQYGLIVNKEPRSITRIVYCWDFSLIYKTFHKLLEENYEDLFIMFATPKDLQLPQKSKESILDDLKSHMRSSSQKRGFFVSSNSMLIISPRKVNPYIIMRSPLIWIYQLVALENFLLRFYSVQLRGLASRLVSATSDQYSGLLEQIVKLREGFSLALEDLYWVENDLFRFQSADFVAKYKEKFKLEETLNALHKRFDWIRDRCIEALSALEHKFLKKREESITNLTLIFASFGLGEILSTFIVWYFGYILMNEPAPTSHLILGLAITLLVVSGIFLIARWYVKKFFR